MKATLSNGIVLEGEPFEIARALREIGGQSVGSNGRTVASTTPAVTGAQIVWSDQAVRKFAQCLFGKQKKLIEFLLKKKSSVSINEIMNHLGLKTGNQLAGILSCITRNARRETGYSEAMAYGYELKDGVWHYFVRPELAENLHRILTE
jgi:hypothetical protein